METYRSGHNGADSKSVCGQPHVGSNPTHSARKRQVSTETCRFQLNPPLRVGEILLCNVKYACGVWNSPRRRVGGFNFTWCDSIKFHNLRSKLFHRERKRTISLKTNGYVRVRIHMQKQQKYLFRKRIKSFSIACSIAYFLHGYFWKNSKYFPPVRAYE